MGRFLFKFIICFFVFFVCHETKSQTSEIGKPIICNYHPREYKGYSQNWGILQDKRGVIYFANGDGVIEYDGVNWDLIPLPQRNTVTSLALDSNNTIFVTGSGEFGYLKPNKYGKYQYVSLLDKIKPEQRDFTFAFDMFYYKGGIYFNTHKYLFQWKFNKITTWPLKRQNSMVILHGKIAVWQDGVGITLLDKGKLVPVHGNSMKDTAVVKIVPYNKSKDLVVTVNNGLYLIDKIDKNSVFNNNRILTKFYTKVDEYLLSNRVLYAKLLKNNLLAILTLKGGTVIIDFKGNLVQMLNKSNGVINDSHNYIWQDDQDALWLALDVGITKAETSSPITFWDDSFGLKGSVLDIERYNGKLYAATWQGAFYMDKANVQPDWTDEFTYESSKYKAIKEVKQQCWDLQKITHHGKTDLLAAATDGLHIIKDSKAEQICSGSFYKILQSNINPELLFVASIEGIFVFEIEANGYKLIKKIKGSEEKSNSLAQDNAGRIWFDYGSTKIGVIQIVKNNILNSKIAPYNFIVTMSDDKSGLEYDNTVYVRDLLGEISIISKKGMYIPSFTKGKLKFEKDERFVNHIFYNYFSVNQIAKDSTGNIWAQFYSKNNKTRYIVLGKKNKDKKYEFYSAPFQPIPQMEMYNFYCEKNIVWMCGDDGLYQYNKNINFHYEKPYRSLVRKVIAFERDTTIFYGLHNFDSLENNLFSQSKNAIPFLNYSFNSLRFLFAAPNFFDESATEYSYILEGYDKKWSAWRKASSKEYTNLSAGNYVFKVKARNIFGKISEIDSYSFVILPPWYLSFWGYFLYGAIFIVLLYLGVVLSNRRLIAAKQRLEHIVVERTSELVKRQQEIEVEKEKSDKLLLNILPFRIAQELKTKGYAKTQFYDLTTVMFADFKGFTKIAQVMEPQQLIKELDKRFMFFDDVCLRHNLEKIKTIGDSYMCVGGIPITNLSNPIDMILAAFEMQEFMRKLALESEEGSKWELRIGMHTGPIIAGVVGKNKFAYDVWGDTVNTASRVESSGEAWKINISGDTYEYIKDFFECSYRGKKPVKNRGEVDMYFVDRIIPELSNDEMGLQPNRLFIERHNSINQL
ncbi:MAG: adenylate/guanylate cyclase domain-containing protein [Bacteroidota bacterium]